MYHPKEMVCRYLQSTIFALKLNFHLEYGLVEQGYFLLITFIIEYIANVVWELVTRKCRLDYQLQITALYGIFLPLPILALADLPSNWLFSPPSTASPTCQRPLSVELPLLLGEK